MVQEEDQGEVVMEEGGVAAEAEGEVEAILVVGDSAEAAALDMAGLEVVEVAVAAGPEEAVAVVVAERAAAAAAAVEMGSE